MKDISLKRLGTAASVCLRTAAALLGLLAPQGVAWGAPPTVDAPFTQTRLFQARLPQPRVLTDVAYGTDPAQKMDLYLPVGFTGLRPGVALIHGGGWQAGDKGFYAPRAGRWRPSASSRSPSTTG